MVPPHSGGNFSGKESKFVTFPDATWTDSELLLCEQLETTAVVHRDPKLKCHTVITDGIVPRYIEVIRSVLIQKETKNKHLLARGTGIF